MTNDWLRSLRHMFKLDPNKHITKQQIDLLAKSGTDAILVGGTLNITYEDTKELLRIIRQHQIIVIQEISSVEAIVPGFDYYFIPLVLNAQNPEWILNAHHKALKRFGEFINWEQVFVEGYIVLNEDSSVAKLTDSNTSLALDDILAYTRMIDQMLKLPIIYIEYSGTFGEASWLKEIRELAHHSRVFYGGGILSLEMAQQVGQYADTIIVGNLIYEDFDQALATVFKKNIP